MLKLMLVERTVSNVTAKREREMSKAERIKNILVDENVLSPTFLDDFDTALIGIIRDVENDKSTPVYSYLKLIEALLEDGVSEEEAVEYVDHAMGYWEDTVVILDDTGV
jgi:hypothetical protein